MILHGYFRSSASWRVRIALGLKGLAFEQRGYRLLKQEQREPGYLAINPQGLVPSLVLDDGQILTQSLAIIEWLDERYPDPPLLPSQPAARARVRAFAQVIACDVHPLQNLKVLRRLRDLGHSREEVADWARQVIADGFDACEAMIAGTEGPYCFGDAPGLADILLIPQLGNADRFGLELRWPRLEAVGRHCAQHPAFVTALPENQPDAE